MQSIHANCLREHLCPWKDTFAFPDGDGPERGQVARALTSGSETRAPPSELPCDQTQEESRGPRGKARLPGPFKGQTPDLRTRPGIRSPFLRGAR